MELSAVVISLNIKIEVELNPGLEKAINISTSASGSAVPLIIVGKMLVGLVISSMDTNGACVSSVNDVDAVPWLPARSNASTVTV